MLRTRSAQQRVRLRAGRGSSVDAGSAATAWGRLPLRPPPPPCARRLTWAEAAGAEPEVDCWLQIHANPELCRSK